MSTMKPVVSVVGPLGTNLVPQWGADLLGVTIDDQGGFESDEAVLRFTAPPVFFPPKGTRYAIAAGWGVGGLAPFGIYTVSGMAAGGDPEGGETIEIRCRAADFLDKMLATGSKHYDQENGHGTAGKIFQSLAMEAGVPAVIAPAIASIEIPYRLRWHQSPLDFATALAEEVGAIIKPQAGRLTVLERGSSASAGGRALPPILIPHDPAYGWEVDLEERTAHDTAVGSWFDPKTGRLAAENAATGRSGGQRQALHLAASQKEARTSAGALAQALGRFTGTGFFEMRGNPAAVAGAPARPSGFGSVIDGIQWDAAAVTHDIQPEEGWITTVEVETREKAG